jgi:multiple sugar transport system substrate-binding protein
MGILRGHRVRRLVPRALATLTAGGLLLPLAGTASAANVIHLTMWQQWGGGHEEQELQTAIQQYEHLHPDIQITQTPVTNDAKILASITGGNPPDIIDLGTSVQLGAWATEGAVEPLGSLVKSAHLKLSDFVPSGLDAVTVNGQLYALPFMNFDIGLLYNKSLFKAAGLGPNDPPATIEQLDSDAAKLTKVSSSGTITQMGFVPDYPGPSQGQECPLESYGWLYGGNWYGKNGDPTPDTSPDIAALAWEKGFYTKYGPQKVANFVASAGAYLTAGDPFESGKLAMMFDGPWTLQYIKANNPKLAPAIGTAKFPAPAGMATNDGTTFVDTNPQLIPRGSKHVAQAFAFITWLTTNTQLASEFANTVANLPQLKDVPPFSLESDSRFQLFEKEAASPAAHTWSQSKISSQYATELCQAQDSALIGGKSASSALKQLVSSLG